MYKRLIIVLLLILFTAACGGEEDRSLDVSLEGDSVSWNEIPYAENYTVTHVGSGTKEITENTTIDLSLFNLEPGPHTFEVCSDTALCETFEYEKESTNDTDDGDNGEDDDPDDDDPEETVIHEGRYRLNLSPTQDLIIPVGKTMDSIHEVTSEGIDLSMDDITIDGAFLILEKTLFDGFNDDLNITIHTDQGIVKIDLGFIDSETPHFISETTLTYDFTSIVLIFEPLGGELVSLSGNDISEDDYEIVYNRLFIEPSYFDAILEDNPDRSTVILGYQFTKDGDITIGYLFINMP